MSSLLCCLTGSSSSKATSQEEPEHTERVLKVTESLEQVFGTSTTLEKETTTVGGETSTPDKKKQELHEACQTLAKALDRAAKEDKLHDAFESVAKAMLTLSTFAAGITFNLLLKPSNPTPPTRAFIFLAYANALFCAALVGCALLMVSIELVRHSFDPVYKWDKNEEGSDEAGDVITLIVDHPDAARFILAVETSVVAAILFVAIYLLLYASSLFLQVPGPLIVGSILYGIFGAMACFVAGISLLIRQKLALEKEIKRLNSKATLKLNEIGATLKLNEIGATLKLNELGAKLKLLAHHGVHGDESEPNRGKEARTDDAKTGNTKEEAMEKGLAQMKERE
ncbi:hypothetical protein L207DRAFT_520532 [Hyaloscypha variabilis F]|uniref:Uncharacterized protein n=1 Tax=Hyaloscypha variabilis (strain UAMH 11265 / GT02V1 / F) TaxID=1149755 RepID=A0A2J6QV64_HYAVF|nr:hypothetical protein L207DRAFT_520532 [Hyaloscypha variabilis F]